jgi:hypothetical protein
MQSVQLYFEGIVSLLLMSVVSFLCVFLECYAVYVSLDISYLELITN